MDNTTLFLNHNSLQCIVSPMVIMTILDHYQRRPDEERQDGYQLHPSFVVGCLFGTKDAVTNTIRITDAFAAIVDINNDNNNIAITEELIQRSLTLHSRLSPKEILVGWYRTGLETDAYSTAIHARIYKIGYHFAQRKSVLAKPIQGNQFVHLLVDTKFQNSKLNIKAYTGQKMYDPVVAMQRNIYLSEKSAREERIQQLKQLQKNLNKKKSKSGGGGESTDQTKKVKVKEEKSENAAIDSMSKVKESELKSVTAELNVLLAVKVKEVFHEIIFNRFTGIPVSYAATEAETIGMDMIIKCPPDGNTLDSPALLLGDANDLELTLQTLLENLEQVEYYVQQVINGEVIADTELGWTIAHAISCVPLLSPQKFEQMLSGRLQDLLMLVYLSKLTKAQLVIADRINLALHSTVPQ